MAENEIPEPTGVEAALTAADWAVRVCAPRHLERAGLRERAAELRALMPITDEATAEAARRLAYVAAGEHLAVMSPAGERAGYIAELAAFAAGSCAFASTAYYVTSVGSLARFAAEAAVDAGELDVVTTLVAGGMSVPDALAVAPLLAA